MKFKFFLALLALVPASLATGLDLFDFDLLDALQEALASPTGWLIGVLIGSCIVASGTANAAISTWTAGGSGRWDGPINWSSGGVASSDAADFITNANPKTVTIDQATNLANLTISNLTIRGVGSSTNTLLMTNTVATGRVLFIRNGFTVGTNAIVTVTNSALRVASVSGGNFAIDGAVTLERGSIVATNSSFIATIIGDTKKGSLVVKAGTMLNSSLLLGDNSGSSGTLSIAGGTNTVTNGGMYIGSGSNGIGEVWIVGSQARLETVTPTVSTSITLGLTDARGQLTISNGSVLTLSLFVGNGARSHGTLRVAGGALALRGGLDISSSSSSTGAVWVTGGQISFTNTIGTPILTVGGGGFGLLTLSNGVIDASRCIVGNFACTSIGIVNIAGGKLFVTNATHNAVLEVRSGTFTLNSGTVTVDQFVMTNSCTHFVRTGGTLICSNAVLAAVRDDDGDGLYNGWEQSHGLDPLDPFGNNGSNGDPDGDGMPNGFEQDHGLDPLNAADAAQDADGDGLSNLQEFLTHTDPTDSESAMRIIEISRQGNDIHLTWTIGLGTTNDLQRADSGPGGSYNGGTNFTTFVRVFVPGSGLTTNIANDIGGATNKPARYYRVRLVP